MAMRRRLITICLLALSAVAVLATAPIASAAKKNSGPKPKITRVTPMRVTVGKILTIRGQHFRAKARSNTVIFRANNGRTAFAKPRRASKTKLVVRVPASVARLLTVKNSKQKPTRLKLRVLAGKFSAYTTRRLSPVVVGVSGSDNGSTAKVCKDDSDHDNDLLANDLELQLGTDPCLADTDGDTMTDGWEYYAAKDLNIKAVPYPGKRPFPNALDPSDGGSGSFSNIDFDGDGLTTKEEYRAWRVTGSSFIASKGSGLDLQSPLGYSDGTKYSRSDEAPGVPQWRGPSYGLPAPTGFPGLYNFRAYDDSTGVWRDDERDADSDGLANWLESARGPGQNSWWSGYWAQDGFSVEAWPKRLGDAGTDPTCAQEPGYFTQRPFAELDLADSDVDGDRLLDGEDDQDNDDYTNIQELYELFDNSPEDQGVCGLVWMPTIGSLAVNAYNPCAPNELSRTCEDYKPF
jgi:IPT/TIG domain